MQQKVCEIKYKLNIQQNRRVATPGGGGTGGPCPPFTSGAPQKVGLRILAYGIVLKFSILHFRICPTYSWCKRTAV